MNWTVNFPVGREILLALILLIVFYMVWLLWQLRGLGRDRDKQRASSRRSLRDEPSLSGAPSGFSIAPAATATPAAMPASRKQDVKNNELPLVYGRPSLRRGHIPDLDIGVEEKTERKIDGGTDNAPPGFQEGRIAQRAFMDGVTRELEETRSELETLRDSFALMRDEMELLRNNLQNTQVAQNASPLYNEAMQMAILGHDALTIAERCGISRAEADLVVSLMKNKDGKTS